MRTSNTILRQILLCSFGFTLPLAADDLTLAGGTSQLSGTVRSIDDSGRVELASPLSDETLFLKGGSVDKVTFTRSGAAPEPPPTMVELSNGDLLPATVESLDAQNLIITSPDTGRLEIPRAHLTSAQFGIRRTQVIYSGPGNLDEWVREGDDPKTWTLQNGGLVASGPATASRDLALPRQFVLRFTLRWQAEQTPNFQVYFASPLKARGEPSDQYYLQFGGAGLELKREATQGKRRFHTIMLLNRSPDQYPDNEIEVEIRVDRDNARLELFINGELEDKKGDPFSPVPDGSGIALVCNAPSGSTQEIRKIEVIESEGTRSRHRSEDRGDSAKDSLITREDDRWGGQLLEILKADGETLFHFKGSSQDEPMEIPEEDVSTVFFATADHQKSDGHSTPFLLRLRSDGVLHVSSCSFTDDTVMATHPLLGQIKLRRDSILAMERTRPLAKPKS